MAIFYGSESIFIKGKQKSRQKKLMWLSLIFLVAIISIIFAYRTLWYLSPIGLVIAFAIHRDLVWGTFRDIRRSASGVHRWKGYADRGLLGERIIKQKLEALPDSYSVFRNFHPDNGADYDFIVVGPNGLFSIEAKSTKGKIGFEPRTKGRSHLSQTKRETFALRKYFLEGWKINTYVNGILAYAMSGAKLPELPQPYESMHVLGGDQVAAFIVNHRGSNPQKALIEERLKFFYTDKV